MSKTVHDEPGRARTVLVIEDSPTQALHLRSMLERERLNVVWAPTGEDGLRHAQRELPDLVVLDIKMPGMDGFEVCRQLKAVPATATIPVIMFTRYDDAQSVMSGLETGVIDYIPKDAFADAVLLETLRQMGLIATASC